jgi:hypothetical protein
MACSRSGGSSCRGINGFFNPIMVPGRKPLITLRDAALYITTPLKAEHNAEERQARPRRNRFRPAPGASDVHNWSHSRPGGYVARNLPPAIVPAVWEAIGI